MGDSPFGAAGVDVRKITAKWMRRVREIFG
jgi:hypothetical protein